jgi:hypothetical protein
MTARTAASLSIAVTIAAAATAHLVAQPPYEGPRTVKVTDVLPAAFVKGAHHTVGPQVTTDGYFDVFTVTSEFGTFEAEGQTVLAVRLREVEALARLAEVSSTEVFVSAAGTAVVNIGKNAFSAVQDPVATARGVGAGIKRFGVNLGRQARRVTENVTEGGDEAAQTSSTQRATAAGESAANAVFGVNSAMRRWAMKVGADPYTTNQALRDALESVGRVDAAGSIAARVVVPIPMVVSSAGSVGNLVWGTDPEELLKLNEKRLAEIGVPGDAAHAFSRARPFTLTYQTSLIDSVYTVKPRGGAEFVVMATSAESEREALFFAESAAMLKALHAERPVTAILPDSRAMVAAAAGGAVVLLPVDWVRWTAPFEKAAAEIAARTRAELGTSRLELHMTGRMSEVARQRLSALGWSITENVPVAVYWVQR